ncbi:enoyl-CoA hydratase-related protein [Pseudohalioglobus lutimaris]|uniref:Enoyl-CoA hydratase n=1 Tax=Pseudohalioglobus lutimaris TaxID=1737061 RepID=A0A2N5X5R0_9GAMM|nr:enoyl-CoA hydratase-related protein [Pseudohalioglobus lutimaris]PLW69823.1 enoyl-CoA hydratase [Pseudohalioglobus lutimaris]
MPYQYINVETEGNLFVLTIDRPEVMNAISPAASYEMAEAVDRFEADDSLWVGIITGSGSDAFCAGGDISVMAAAKTNEDYQMPPSGYGGMTNRTSCNKPIIAAVNGICFGGGFEVALACDLVIASENASFGLPEPKIGTAAVATGMHRLAREIGLKPAMALLLTGDAVDAERARALGLVTEVVPEGEALTAAKKLAARILRCAPLAVQATKQCVLGGLNHAGVPAAQKAQENGAFPALQTMMESQDISEGLNAFLEKRRPKWKGC